MSLKAVRDMVIVKVVYAEKSKTIVIPDGVKQYSCLLYTSPSPRD